MLPRPQPEKSCPKGPCGSHTPNLCCLSQEQEWKWQPQVEQGQRSRKLEANSERSGGQNIPGSESLTNTSPFPLSTSLFKPSQAQGCFCSDLLPPLLSHLLLTSRQLAQLQSTCLGAPGSVLSPTGCMALHLRSW